MIITKIGKPTLEFLRDIISGDKKNSPYLSGPKIVDFFTDIGIQGYYGQGFPSRWFYTEQKLGEINGTAIMTQAIVNCFDKRRFIDTEFDYEQLIKKFNQFFSFDGYILNTSDNLPRVMYLGDNSELMEDIKGISNERIKEDIEKCEGKVKNGDFSGAITSARTLLETVLLYLYKEKTTIDYKYDGDLLKLYKEIQKVYSLFPEKEADTGFKQLLQGLTAVINGLASIRNKIGDAHGNATISKKPERNHATLCINAVRTISIFLLNLSGDTNIKI